MAIQNRIRWGIWALPLSGLLSTIAALVPGVGIDPAVDPGGFARASSNIGLSNMLGIPSAALLLIGILALYLFLAGTPVDRPAFSGLLLILTGTMFFLPFIGIYAFTAPVLGRRYLSGEKTAISAISESASITNPTALVFGGIAVFLLALGAVMFGTAIWRSKHLPKWPGLLLAVGIVLSADPLFYYQPIIWVAGGALVLFGGVWIARHIYTTTNDERTLR